MKFLLKQPSAWVPIVLSLFILFIIVINISLVGVIHQADEGTAAHLFQIWIVVEALSVAFFAIKWLPKKNTIEMVKILALQVVVALLPLSIVFILKL